MSGILFENENFRIWRKPDPEGGGDVLVKTYNSEFPDPETVLMMKNEFRILNGLEVEGVRKLIGKTRHNGKEALIFPYIEGESLGKILESGSFGVNDFLNLAVKLSTTLKRIHQLGIVHKDINPGNIILEPSGKPWIIDFGIASKADPNKQNLNGSSKLQGNLYYISPEQSGRINRIVDFRSDLYSLGQVFYRVLTGKTAFDSSDPLELIHCHLAVNPPSPVSLRPDIPDILSRIVMKLVSKSADDRYQSAESLRSDLSGCLDEYHKNKSIESFELGKKHSAGRFIIPQKLYGRERELQELASSFENLDISPPQLILICGEPGVGKSALVKEMQTELIGRRVELVSGKFDQYQRNIPYFAIQKALSEWVQSILGEPDEKLQQWKEIVTHATGDLIKLVVELVPELEIITGPPPPVPELSGQEAQNRFNFVLKKFMRAISGTHAPLAVFIDDLQWADSASLELIKQWLQDVDNRNFIIIGAYRDNEVDGTHPLRIMESALKKAGVLVKTLPIDNLPYPDVERMIAHTLFADASSIGSLAGFIHEKTNGNPIFIKQFLMALHREGLLRYDSDSEQWNWDLEAINRLNFSDNIVDLMMTKIRKLPEATQHISKLAACIGSEFDIEVLSLIVGKPLREVVRILRPAIDESLIVPKNNYLFNLVETDVELKGEKKLKFNFIHDRIQQAFYALFPAEEKKHVHLKIGRLLNEKVEGKKREEKIFDIVFHLNTGLEYLEDQTEKTELAALNLKAGQKAIGSSAYETALDIVEKGIRLLPDQSWRENYSLTFELFETAAEAAYLLGDHEKMNHYIDEVIANAVTIPEQKKVYMLRIDQLTAANMLPEALKTGLEILKKLEVKFPSKPSMLHIVMGLVRTKFMLRNKKPEDLKELPVMSDPSMIAALPILERIVPPAYMSGSNLFPLIVFKMVSISVRHGNMPYSAFGYASYGISLSAVMGQFDSGYRFGQMALELVDRLESEEYRVKVLFVTDCFLNHWKHHLRDSIEPLLDSYKSGMKVGNLVGGIWGAYYHLLWQYLTACELNELKSEVDAFRKTFLNLKQNAAYNRSSILYNAIDNLTGGKEVGTDLAAHFEGGEKAMLEELKSTNDKTTFFFYYSNKMFLHLLRNEIEEAIAHSEKAKEYSEAVLGLPELTFITFFESLAFICHALENRSRRYRKKLKKNLANLKKWAKTSPANYEHMMWIVDAGYLAVRGRKGRALELLDRGIQGASSEKYVQIEAMACELGGRYLKLAGHPMQAQLFFTRAHQAYHYWGATAKAKMLAREFEYLSSSGGQSLRSGVSLSSDRHSGMLDMHTLMKASTTISGEIRLEGLMQTLLKILIENAGAQYAGLIMDVDGKLQVVASGNIQEVKSAQGKKLDETSEVPVSIILYCYRTGEEQILSDASSHEKWSADPYIHSNKVKSVLCIPIKSQGRTTAVLYLENNLVSNAFTAERVELLRLLSGQIAISLENANLYHNLEDKVRQRTQMIEQQKSEIEKQKAKSDELLLNVMPAVVAEELKKYGKTKAKNFTQVSVLFIDVVGFTRIAENLVPQELVDEIDFYFSRFDQIIRKHHLEKIKTIGDAYLAVGGLPEDNTADAVDVVAAALDIQDFVKGEKERRINEGRRHFDVRAGIHTGSVTSGVVGLSKFQYDIWGDAVNIAARMEQNSEPGRVNISVATYALVKDVYSCDYRGKIEAKNKGAIDMYFVVNEGG